MLKKVVLIVLSAILFSPTANADGVGFFGWTDIYYESPIWSKDGTRIYFIKNVEHRGPSFALAGSPEKVKKLESYIMSMRPDGSDKKVITKFITTKEGFLTRIDNLIVSPDDQQLIFFSSTYLRDIKQIESGIYRINTNGSSLTSIINFENFIQVPSFFLSPNGKKIAYTKGKWEKGDSVRSSWLIDLNGQNNRMIYEEDSYVKGWTVDGEVVLSKYREDSYDIYDPILNSIVKKVKTRGLIGEEFEALMKSLNIIERTYVSPDGKKEIFWERENLGVMDIDGKNKKILLKGKRR